MFRDAGAADLMALMELERAANLRALGHIFPPERYPFPADEVLARWRIVTEDPDVSVLVADRPDGRGLLAFAAHDATTLRHLAVHPDHWGEGIATAAVKNVLRAMGARGSASVFLWCLWGNHRARRFYEYLGWRRTDDVREAFWPPHPEEIGYSRLIPASEAGRRVGPS